MGVGLALLVVVSIIILRPTIFRSRSAEEWQALETVAMASDSLLSARSTELPDLFAMTPALSSKTPGEQANFLAKALRGEVTEEGLQLLRRDGRFGSLAELFPDDGARWASAAGVNIEDCVAFRLDRSEHTMEVALVTNVSPWRLVRLNDVRP